MIEKIKKIRADLPEYLLNSGYFITILHKNSGKLSTAQPRTQALFSTLLPGGRDPGECWSRGSQILEDPPRGGGVES